MKVLRLLGISIWFILLLATITLGQNEIFRSKWVGTSVDGFTCPGGEFVDSFVASNPGAAEWQVLTAWSTTTSNDIFRTKLAGMSVQTFKPLPGGHINAFSVVDSSDGYIHLRAHSSTGERGTIIRSKLAGTGAQVFTAPAGEYVTEIVGRDSTDEYIYLVIAATELGIFELTGFTATPRKKYVLLEWRTEAEFESYQWLVQRKLVDGEYETIGTLDAQGHSSKPTEYEYKDDGVTLGEKYFYRLLEVDLNGEKTEFGPLFVDMSTRDLVPPRLYIAQNFPNPFERMTTIKFGIPLKKKDEAAKLVIYDVTGRIVKTLISGKLEPGYYHVTWNGKEAHARDVGAGVFFYRLTVGDENLTKKMIYVK
jgi:hypothetical protein